MKYSLTIGVALFALAQICTANAQPPTNDGNTNYNDTNALGDPINFLPNFAPLTYLATPSGTGGAGGLIGGGAGCNWQSQQWVLGVEGDFDWAHFARSNITSAFSGPTQFGIGPGTYTGIDSPGTVNEQVSVQWLSTIRGRAAKPSGAVLLT